MEEKKLTDEEIVKALECCSEHDNCFDCPIMEEKKLDKDINVRSKKILANRVYSDTTLKKWSKEDLIEHIRILEHNWSCAEETLYNSVKNSEKIFYEQKAEIELLSKVIGSSKRKTKILELQKEIERLTKQREVGREKLKNEIANKIFMSASHGAIQCGKMSIAIAEIEAEKYVEFAWEMVQQAVKDTAKEILDEVSKHFGGRWLVELYKKYGLNWSVEVE